MSPAVIVQAIRYIQSADTFTTSPYQASHKLSNYNDGRAMAQAVSRRPLTTEARVRSRVSSCGIFGGQSGNETGFSPTTSIFPCQFHSTGAPLQGKMKKKN
jgi:hypothetical protein